MIKYGCTMSVGSDIFFATLIAEDAKQAREMAAAETKQGRPRNGASRYWTRTSPARPVPRPRKTKRHRSAHASGRAEAGGKGSRKS